MNFRKFLKPGILVILVMFIATMLTACGNSPKSVAKSYLNASKKGDAKKLLSLMYKEEVEEMLEEQDVTKKEYIKDAKEEWKELDKDIKKRMKKTKYKIVEVDDFKEEELEKMQEVWDKKDYDKPLADAKKVNLEVKYDGDEWDSTVYVIKVGSKWYYSNFPMTYQWEAYSLGVED